MSTTPNEPMLRKYVEWVEEQDARPAAEREWFQPFWGALVKAVDHTPSGLAGHHMPVSSTDLARAAEAEVYEGCHTAYCLAGKVCHDAGLEVRYDDGHYEPGGVAYEAAKLLGITNGNAEALFRYSNTAPEVRAIAEKIVGNRL